MAGPYSIGSDHLPGLSKLIEELGECGQVAGKILGHGGFGEHWDGSDLKTRLEDELADVLAAVHFVGNFNHLDFERVLQRAERKLLQFREWHEEQSR